MTKTLLLVCDDRGARGQLCDLLEGTGSAVEEASSRYDLAGIVEDVACTGAFVVMGGLKKDLVSILSSIADECVGLPVAIVGPGAGAEDFAAMLRARIVVDYVETADEPAFAAAIERMEAESRRAAATNSVGVAHPAAAQQQAGSPIERMVASIKDGTFHLPALGDTMARLQGIGDSEHAAISDVEAVVGADAALVGAVLREANSTMFGGKNPVTSLRAACMRLGIPRVLTLAREALMTSVLPTEGDVASTAMEAWDRGLLSRTIAGMLAEDVGLVATKVNDSMLLHDVGELALLKVLADELGPRSLTEDERSQTTTILAKNHEAVGALILKSWGMPMELVRLAACHHAQAPRWPETRPETSMRNLARICDHAAAWTLGEREDGPDDGLLRHVGLTNERVVAMCSKAMQVLESAA